MVVNESVAALGVTLRLAYDTEAMTLSVVATSQNERSARGEDLVGIYQTPLTGFPGEAKAHLYVSKGKSAGHELNVVVGDRVGFAISGHVGCTDVGVDILEDNIRINR